MYLVNTSISSSYCAVTIILLICSALYILLPIRRAVKARQHCGRTGGAVFPRLAAAGRAHCGVGRGHCLRPDCESGGHGYETQRWVLCYVLFIWSCAMLCAMWCCVYGVQKSALKVRDSFVVCIAVCVSDSVPQFGPPFMSGLVCWPFFTTGITILAVLQQPRAEIFERIDHLFLMDGEGNIVFEGDDQCWLMVYLWWMEL